MAKKIVSVVLVDKAVRRPRPPSQAIENLKASASKPSSPATGTEKAPTRPKMATQEAPAPGDEHFTSTRTVTSKAFDISEQVMKEIEDELFQKEEAVRTDIQSVLEEKPEKIDTILETASTLDGKELKDFVKAAETLYKGREGALPGSKDKWASLKKKAEKVGEDAPQEKAAPMSVAEQYARRERAIDLFRRTMLSDKSDRIDMRRGFKAPPVSNKEGALFFGPSVEDDTIRAGSGKGLMQALSRSGKRPTQTGAIAVDDLDAEAEQDGMAAVQEATDKVEEEDQLLAKAGEKVEKAFKGAPMSDERVIKLNEDLARLSSSLEERDGRIIELEERIKMAGDPAEKDRMLKELQQKVEERDSAIATMKEEATELSSKMKEQEKAMGEAQDQKEAEVDELQEQMQDLSKQLEEAKARCTALEGANQDSSKEKAEVEAKLKDLSRLEDTYKRNHEALKQIAKENLEKEIQVNKQEIMLEEFERELKQARKEMDEEKASLQKLQANFQARQGQISEKEAKLTEKGEGVMAQRRELLKMKEEQEAALATMQQQLSEKKALDAKMERRIKEIEAREKALAEKERMLAQTESKRPVATSALLAEQAHRMAELEKERELLERSRMELKKKEELLEARMAAGAEGGTEEMLLTEGLDQRRSALDKREDELRNLEIILKKRWAKIQIEAKKLSEERARSQLGAFGGAMPAATASAPVPATAATTAPPPPAGDVEMRPLLRVRCIGCKKPIPIYSSKRPLKVECNNCGKVGILR